MGNFDMLAQMLHNGSGYKYMLVYVYATWVLQPLDELVQAAYAGCLECFEHKILKQHIIPIIVVSIFFSIIPT